MLLAALFGFLFGFFGSIPIAGPIAVLVMARGLAGRFRSGLLISVGGALAEAVYAFLAFWGFGTFLSEYPWITLASKGAAALILIVLGVVFVLPAKTQPGVPEEVTPLRPGGVGSFMLGFSISAMNPTIIVTWTAAATFMFSTEWVQFSTWTAVTFGLGCCVGIAGWFALMLFGMFKFHSRFSPDSLDKVRRGTGALVILLGLYFAIRFVLLLT